MQALATTCLALLPAVIAGSAAVPAWPAEMQPSESHEREPEESHSRISDEVIPPQVDAMPNRPKPLLELGDPFLDHGSFRPGTELPTGEVLQPSLLVFGTLRTAYQSYDDGALRTSQWVNRLDLYANLQLSGSERILLGMRPLDQNNRFTSYNLRPKEEDHFEDHFNGRITTLFLEGDIGEILPGLDEDDSSTFDYGFSVGRQPLLVQDGLLIDDTIDSIGIVRNSLLPTGTANLRLTGLFGWNDIHRNDNREDSSVLLFAVFGESDLRPTTLTFDAVWIYDEDGETDGLYFGIGAAQRIRSFNTTFRVVQSFAPDGESAAISRGTLLFAELSLTPPRTDDLLYLDAFWGIDEFSSAARGPDTGGPLGRTGILFSASGLGRFGPPLSNRADDAVGAALGYQWVMDGWRRQLIVEIGGREETRGPDTGALAIGARLQQAIGRRMILRADAFVSWMRSRSASTGVRSEVIIKF